MSIEMIQEIKNDQLQETQLTVNELKKRIRAMEAEEFILSVPLKPGGDSDDKYEQ